MIKEKKQIRKLRAKPLQANRRLNQSESVQTNKHGLISLVLQFGLLAGMLLFLVLWRHTEQTKTLALIFSSIILEGFPFIAVGAILSGMLAVFVGQDQILKWFPKGWKSVFLAAGLGLIFPVCECAIVPVVRRLLGKNIPLGAGIAFLLGGPIVNPLVAASTAVAYQWDWGIVLLRLGAGYAIACTAGLIASRLFNLKDIVKTQQTLGHPACAHGPMHNPRPELWLNIRYVLSHAIEDFYAVARYFVLGAFVAALLQTFVARQVFVEMTADSSIAAILVMMVLAFVLNLCSEADAFVAAAFQATRIPLVGQMAFMVLGPMLDVKLLAMYLGVFHKKMIWMLASLIVTLVFISMLIIGLWLR